MITEATREEEHAAHELLKLIMFSGLGEQYVYDEDIPMITFDTDWIRLTPDQNALINKLIRQEARG